MVHVSVPGHDHKTQKPVSTTEIVLVAAIRQKLQPFIILARASFKQQLCRSSGRAYISQNN